MRKFRRKNDTRNGKGLASRMWNGCFWLRKIASCFEKGGFRRVAMGERAGVEREGKGIR
jgi:hypothetical protein